MFVLRRALPMTAVLLAALLLIPACTQPAPESGEAGGETAGATGGDGGDPSQVIRFWHTQTQENEEALKKIVAEFNEQNPGGLPIEATYIGGYPDLYEKIKALAASGDSAVLPDLAVAYESMIADYMAADIVRPLDDFVSDPQLGFDEASLADIHDAYLETNRFPQFDNQLLSFPFTKSNLVLYYNQTMLEEAGVEPPETWDDFLAACRAIKAKRGIRPLGVDVDASTIDGIIMSMGGELLAEGGTDALFDQPATVETLALYDSLFAEDLAYQVVDKGDLNNDFANQQCAFFFRSSTARPFLQELIGDKFAWNLQGLPHKAGVDPVTVMFGANICILKSNPEREQRAWAFIKHFASVPVTTEWAMATGYLPVRKSAADSPELLAFFEAAEQNRSAFDLLDIARPEPNVAGWQKVRDCIENAQTAIINQLAEPQQAATELDQCADAALNEGR